MPEVVPDMALEDSIEGTVLRAVEQRIKALVLPSIGESKVRVQKIPWVPDNDQLQPPYVLVTPVPETTAWQDGTNEKNVIRFAVLVSLVVANARDVGERLLGTHLFWCERIRRKFHNRSPVTWSELADGLNSNFAGNFFLHSYVESGDKFIEAAKRDQRDASYYVIRVHVREASE